MNEINAMLCGFVRADENYGNFPSVALLQNGVFVDVHFAQGSAKFAEQGRDGSLGFFAKMAAGT